MLKDITEPGYAVDARQMNAGLDGSFANLQQEMFANTYMLLGGTAVPPNADLNNFKEIGNYYCSTNSATESLKNCPTIYAFNMKVEFSVGINYPCQLLREYSGGTLYYRCYIPELNTWYPWYEFRGTAAQ